MVASKETQMVLSYDNSIILSNGQQSPATSARSAAFNELRSSDYR